MPAKDRQSDRILQNFLARLHSSVSSVPLGNSLPPPGQFHWEDRAEAPVIIRLPGQLSQKMAALFNKAGWLTSERRHFSYFNDLIKANVATPDPDFENGWRGQSIQGYLSAVREL